jgi:NAD(P)-dependent dehydrogenase (short-subunit alcohol dehydrogenase family)
VINISWNFFGRTALITGTSRGVGLATANLLAPGADVFGVSRTPARETPHSRVRLLRGGVCGRGGLVKAADVAARVRRRIDISVANAGVVLVEDFAVTSERDWVDVANVHPPRRYAPRLHTWGIQPAAAVLSRSPRPPASALIATRRLQSDQGGAKGLVQALAVEYASQNVTVNAIAPGDVETDLNRQGRSQAAKRLARSEKESVTQLIATHIPSRRLGRVQEIPSLVGFLSPSESAHITRQTIVIDGGQLSV